MEIKKRPYIFFAIIALYAGIFLVGISVYKDYGVGWDEPDQILVGNLNHNYVTLGDLEIFTNYVQYNGPFYENILTGLIGGVDSSVLLLKRHLLTFITAFIGLLAYGVLIMYMFKKTWLVFCGVLFLILSPRIFADSFYNSKDIPFMVLFILGCLSQVWFLNSPSLLRAALHALACAAAIDTRMPALILPLITLAFMILKVLISNEEQKAKLRHYFLPVLFFLIVCGGLVVLFYPLLWSNTLQNFNMVLRVMGHYPWEGSNFYLGKYYLTTATPWHYILVWIAITTPFLYLFLATLGMVLAITNLVSRLRYIKDLGSYRNDLLVLSWSILPWVGIILIHSFVYNGWRHMYFIYPGILLFSLRGLQYLAGIKFLRFEMMRVILVALVVAGLVAPLSFIITRHPYQNLYFNRLAGSSLNVVKQSFDLDYWGLSYRKGLEYILTHDTRPKIFYTAQDTPGKTNLLILPPSERIRLVYTPDIQQADYFITNYLDHSEDYPYPDEIYTLFVADAKLLSVFRLR
jgi:hypothetical protein